MFLASRCRDWWRNIVVENWWVRMFIVISLQLIEVSYNIPTWLTNQVDNDQLPWYNSLWLWRWLPHRLSKRQSLSTTTVVFRTTFTRTIKLNLLEKEKDKDELVTAFTLSITTINTLVVSRWPFATQRWVRSCFVKAWRDFLKYIISNRTTTMHKHASCRFPFVVNTMLSFSFIQK